MDSSKLSIRVTAGNPNHHLWNNNGTWYYHFTVHLPNYTKERIRGSLKTNNLSEARRRRDTLLNDLRSRESVANQTGEIGNRKEGFSDANCADVNNRHCNTVPVVCSGH